MFIDYSITKISAGWPGQFIVRAGLPQEVIPFSLIEGGSVMLRRVNPLVASRPGRQVVWATRLTLSLIAWLGPLVFPSNYILPIGC